MLKAMSKERFNHRKEKEEISIGFMDRMASANGRKVLARRRERRHKLTVSEPRHKTQKIMFV
jgi:large subunit ribosomal protein L34